MPSPPLAFDKENSMFKRNLVGPLLLALLLSMLSACATTTPGSMQGAVEVRSGVIEQITDVQISNTKTRGVGAVIGGALGLGAGSLIGGGTGRDVAMVLGTIGGAVAGNTVQRRNQQPTPGHDIIVRLTNGVLVSVTQEPTNLRVGQKVFIQGKGEDARVTPAN
jgi:outer membrane lipoprotein SlyB